MVEQLGKYAAQCRANYVKAKAAGNYIEAERWKQAALQLKHVMRTIQITAIVPKG